VLTLCSSAKAHEVTFPSTLVDNLVRSWTFAALEQVLRETATSSLPFTRYLNDGSTGSSGKSLSFGGHAKEQKLRVSEPKSMIHPSRSSSLSHGRSSADPPYSQPTSTGQVVFENGQYNDRPTSAQESALPPAKNGLQELAGTRAQLVAVQRRLLEQIGKSLGWNIGWAAVLPSVGQHEELSEVNLADEEDEEEMAEKEGAEPTNTTKVDESMTWIFTGALSNAVSSIDQFRQFYEVRSSYGSVERRLTIEQILSDLIVKHYMAAGQNKSAESVLGDLAALRL
jgi:trafficking protein particle complex subunit 10